MKLVQAYCRSKYLIDYIKDIFGESFKGKIKEEIKEWVSKNTCGVLYSADNIDEFKQKMDYFKWCRGHRFDDYYFDYNGDFVEKDNAVNAIGVHLREEKHLYGNEVVLEIFACNIIKGLDISDIIEANNIKFNIINDINNKLEGTKLDKKSIIKPVISSYKKIRNKYIDLYYTSEISDLMCDADEHCNPIPRSKAIELLKIPEVSWDIIYNDKNININPDTIKFAITNCKVESDKKLKYDKLSNIDIIVFMEFKKEKIYLNIINVSSIYKNYKDIYKDYREFFKVDNIKK